MGALADSAPYFLVESDSLALADGAAVSSWAISGSVGGSVTQGTAASQPTYQTAETTTGLGAVQFDGTNDALARSTGTYTGFLRQTVMAVVKVAGSGVDRTILGTGGSTGVILRVNAAGQAELIRGSGQVYVAGGTVLPSGFVLISANLALVHDASASSTSGTAWPELAVDGVTSGGWVAAATPTVGSPQWLRVRLGTATVVSSVDITNATINTAPTDFTIQGSNDASSWTTLDTRTGVTWSSSVQTQTFAFSNSTPYLYYRLHITACVTATAPQIREFNVGVTHSPTQDIRVNGVTDGTGAITNLPGNNVETRIGSQVNATNAPFNGLVAFVARWDRTLTATELAAVEAEVTAKYLGVSATTGAIAATLPALSASAAGTVPTMGTIAATLPALTASATGTVETPGETGTIAATLPALTASITGDVPQPITGAIGATLPRLSASLTDSTVVYTPVPMEFLIGSALQIGSVADVTPVSMEFLLSTALRLNLPREWAADPRTSRPQYQWVITDRHGARYGELDAVTADDVEEGVNERGETAFTIGTDDPKRALIQPIVRECQVWRGGDLLHRGPIMIGRESDDGATTTYVVPDFRWYYEGRGSADGANRLMARVPRLQLLKNGGFTQGFTYWRALYDAESIPALPPLYTIVDDPETLSGRAIDVTGADESQLHTEDVATSAVFVPNESTYLSGGEAIIEAVGENIPDGATVRITGHTANDGTGSGLGLSHDRALAAKATLAAQNGTLQFVTPDTSKWKPGQYVTGGNVAGRGYYEPISKQLAPNRRVTIAYDGTLPATGHKQFIVQTYYIAHPTTAKYPLTLTANARYKLLEYIGASADGWNLRVRAVRTSTLEEYDSNSASISEDTPLNRWFDLEASVEIPADGNSYRIDVRLYPPAGTARFADVGLYPEELLYFWGIDQAHIVRDVLAFAQDPDYGWSDLGITTRTPVTGVTRDRSYELTSGSPLPVKQVLDEFPSLAHGVDIGVTMRHDLSRVDTHYPRQGGPTNVVLVEGGAVVRARPASDRDAFSLVLVRASEGGRYRPEALAKDDAALDGLRLAKYLTAESETPITELDEAARDELGRSKVTTPAYIVECDPAYTSELRSRLDLGDTCRLILPRYGFDGLVRMMQRAQDPNTDGLTLLLTVED